MKAHQKPVGKNDEWLTPPGILEKLGPFHLDPCAPKNPPWRMAYFHYETNGLERKWHGRVWLNPPFNRNQRHLWMRKMVEHGDGIMLIPAATETRAFVEFVWKAATAVCFVEGRPRFHYVTGERARANCGCSIALVAYGADNALRLERSGLGTTIRLQMTAQAAD